MLRKHRLRVRVGSIPMDVTGFRRLIEAYASENNGYIEPKSGFEYIGGRVAQRALYDSLRDIAHFAKENAGFRPPPAILQI